MSKWFPKRYERWKNRNRGLDCPHCKKPASPQTFSRGRHMLGTEVLTCERCKTAFEVIVWRLEADRRAMEGKIGGWIK
jgi:hypothetical protein